MTTFSVQLKSFSKNCQRCTSCVDLVNIAPSAEIWEMESFVSVKRQQVNSLRSRSTSGLPSLVRIYTCNTYIENKFWYNISVSCSWIYYYRKCPKYRACVQDQLLALGVIWEHADRGGVSPHVGASTYFLANLFWKLHENERNFTQKGECIS